MDQQAAVRVFTEIFLADLGLDRVRSLDEYRALQREWKNSFAGKGEWAPEPEVRLFARAGGERYLSVVHATPSCQDFSGALTAIFEERDGKLVLVNDRTWSDLIPLALLEDGMGLEVIGTSRDPGNYQIHLGYEMGDLIPWDLVTYPFNDEEC